MNQLEGRLAEIFDSIADGVTVLDRSWIVRFANDAAAELMGRARGAEVVGLHSAELTGEWELLDAEGGAFDMQRMPTHRAFAGEPNPEELIRFRQRESAQDRWSMVRARLLPGDTPEADLVVTAFQDVTSLKRSEARLRILAEASAILAESVDYQQTLAKVAHIAVPQLADWCVVDVLEWTRDINRVVVAHADPERVALAEELQRRWPADPDRPGAVQQMLLARQPVHVPEMTDELLRQGAQDEEHLALLRRLDIRSVLIVPLASRGEILGALTLVQSETNRVMEPDDIALAEELGRMAGTAIDAAHLVWEAQETATLRDEFIAVASHDMRTPLATMRGYAQLGRRYLAETETLDRERLDHWLADIDGTVDRLNQLVNELMDVSLVRGGQEVPLQPTSTDLVEVVREVLDRHAGLTDGYRFELELPDESPIGIWDGARLARVLENLIDNAMKFSPDGGDIRVRVGRERDGAFVSVSDRGMGIAPSERELIFNPMYRGRNAGGVVGTGIGLAGSRRLIQQMGGSVTVDSEPGKGATFTVWLPLQPPAPRPRSEDDAGARRPYPPRG